MSSTERRYHPPRCIAAADGEDPLAWVFYTSGTTGTPKGAMFTESLCIGTWLAQSDQPVITLSYMPMSHLIGYGYVIMTLANGGTSYFAGKERPVDAVRRPGDGAADHAEPGAAGLRDVLSTTT